MKIKLIELEIKDFSKLENKVFKMQGNNVKIYGDNGTGKTTVANSFSWLLFGKNIEGKVMKNIIPKNDNGDELLDKTPTVKATLKLDDETLTLERRSEPVKKKNEYGVDEYSASRKTGYFVNDVPYAAKDFNAYIEQLVNEEVFKLVTNVNEFARMNWKDKRELLFNISGDIDKKEIIERDDELAFLNEFENDKEIEHEKKRLTNLLKESKNEINNIPSKITLLHNQIADFKNEDVTDDIATLEKELEELKLKRLQLENGNGALEIKNEIAAKKQELERIKKQHKENEENKINNLKSKIKMFDSDILNLENNLGYADNQRLNIEKNMKDKREQWLAAKEKSTALLAEEYKEETTDICSCCGQTLPPDKIKEHNTAHKEKFNAEKSQRLEEFEKEMNAIAIAGKAEADDLDKVNKDIDNLAKRITDVNKEKELCEGTIKRLENAAQAAEETVEYKSLAADLERLEGTLKGDTGDNTGELDSLHNEITNKAEKLKGLMTMQANKEMVNGIKEDIEKLKAEEAANRESIEKYSYLIYLIDKYTTLKVKTITEKVNAMFDKVEFKMFEEQVNGEIKETCEITVAGVSYENGLNNAMRINAGLEIIDVISKYYNFYAPIFIDNSESVTDMYDTEAQQVKLLVSEDDKDLRMELA